MPVLGQGDLTGSYRSFRAQTAFYLATYVSSAVAAPPATALGTAEPASATWTKQGLMQGDDFTVTSTDPTFIEERRGFTRQLFGRAVTESGLATFETLLQETDPATIALLSGDSTDALGGGGVEIKVKLDQLYDYSALLYAKNVFDTAEERYIFVPHAQVRFALDRGDADAWVLRVQFDALSFNDGSTTYAYREGRLN